MNARLLWLAALAAAVTMAGCYNSQPENTQPADTDSLEIPTEEVEFDFLNINLGDELSDFTKSVREEEEGSKYSHIAEMDQDDGMHYFMDYDAGDMASVTIDLTYGDRQGEAIRAVEFTIEKPENVSVEKWNADFDAFAERVDDNVTMRFGGANGGEYKEQPIEGGTDHVVKYYNAGVDHNTYVHTMKYTDKTTPGIILIRFDTDY